MTLNTVFVYENSIGKITFRYNSNYHITDLDGVSSETVDIAESRSVGQVGSTPGAQSIQPREFTVNGVIFEPLEVTRAELIRIMAPLVNSTLTVIDGAASWYLDVAPTRTPEIGLGEGVQEFQVQLKACYPHWRTTDSYATMLSGISAMFKFPFYTGGQWYISKYSNDYFSNIRNEGNAPTGFTVRMQARGEVVNPEIYHVEARKRVLIRKTLVANELVIISTDYGSRGVTVISPSGVSSNWYRYSSIDSDLFMELAPGDNTIRVNADEGRNNLFVRVFSPKGVKSGV